jgi:hypothetical protein
MTFDQIKFIVQRDGVSSYMKGADLADNLQTGDVMVVNRPRHNQTLRWTISKVKTDFIYTIDTRLQGSANNVFGFASSISNIPLDIDWGDGTVENIFFQYEKVTHTYLTPGIYSITISSSVSFQPYANNDYGQGVDNGAWDYAPQVIDITKGQEYVLPEAFALFRGMVNLPDVSDLAWVFNYTNTSSCGAMFQRSALMTQAPSLKVRGFKPVYTSAMFEGQTSLTYVPLDFMDTSRVVSMQQFFENCTSLQSIPLWDISTLTENNLYKTFKGCTSLTSFPYVNWFQGMTNARSTWENCTSLVDFAPNVFDDMGELEVNAGFSDTWTNCALSVQSIENIFESIQTLEAKYPMDGRRISVDGGTNAPKSTWTQTTIDAFDYFISKGWIIEYNP